jgi:hypothetical protein
MKTNQFPQPILTARTTNQRRWFWLSLGLSAIVATLAIAFYAAYYSQTQLAQPPLVQSQAIDAATQGVNGYIRAHANVDQATAIDPAVAGVNGYLNAHRVAQTAQLDAAMQGVNGYIRAHANVEQATAIDPAVQSVNDYLRAHSK